jgi:hypothetical protein
MLDLAKPAMACLSLVALPFLFIGQSRSCVKHPLRAKWDEVT